jgi:leader peptidase (prepilin peptidase)/N-methyltransferase
MDIFFAIITFLFGLCIGSFLNVLIYRLPLEMSVSKGFSMCPDCNHRLHWQDLFPVFSWLFLRGRCRYCQKPISPRYMAVELLTACLFLAVWFAYGLTWATIGNMAVVAILIPVIFIDAKHMIIPNELPIALVVVGIYFCIMVPEPGLIARLIGVVVIAVPLSLIALVSGGRAMGGGDIKLMAAIGLCLGWQMTLISFIIGTFVGCIFAVVIQRKLGGQVAFGPYLAAGIIFCLFFGGYILDWYITFL